MVKDTLFLQSVSVARDSHPTVNGFQFTANFEATLSGAAHATILVVVSWNATKTLIKGSVNTETQITEAGVSIAKSGLGWAEVLELPGEDGWVEHNGRIIRFAKRFGLQVPVSPVLAGLPVVGETMKELGATMT